MQYTGYKKGFTLVELLIALSVSSLILTAVATLAFALSSAHNSTEDTSEKQAQVRYTTLTLSDMIRQCRLICNEGNGDMVVWRADDNADGKMNTGELVYIEAGSGSMQLLDFPSSPEWLQEIPLSWFQDSSLHKTYLKMYCDEREVVLIPECSNVQFQFDESPPQSRFVSITFEITEDGTVRQYEIDGALRSWAGNLLNSTGTLIISDDD